MEGGRPEFLASVPQGEEGDVIDLITFPWSARWSRRIHAISADRQAHTAENSHKLWYLYCLKETFPVLATPPTHRPLPEDTDIVRDTRNTAALSLPQSVMDYAERGRNCKTQRNKVRLAEESCGS